MCLFSKLQPTTFIFQNLKFVSTEVYTEIYPVVWLYTIRLVIRFKAISSNKSYMFQSFYAYLVYLGTLLF